jgi:hypothetical protein
MNESMIFTNSFGSVTNKRVIINYKGGVQDIPISQVTSVSFERKQNKILSAVYFLSAIGSIFLMVSSHRNIGIEVILIFLLLVFLILAGISNYIGRYYIGLTIAGKEAKPIKVEMGKVKEGSEFYQAIRKQIIN